MARPAVKSSQAGLFTMPDPYELWRSESDGWVSVGKGLRLLARFQSDDKAMRNLSLVALTDAGVPGKDLAALFSMSAEHLSRLRTRVTEEGSTGLLGGVVGRPRSMSGDGDESAWRLFDEGNTQTEIAAKLNVSRFSVARALKRRPSTEPAELPLEDAAVAVEESSLGDEEGSVVDEAEPRDEEALVVGEEADPMDEESEPSDEEAGTGVRLGEVEVRSRYAGAMLLHDFLSNTGAGGVLSSLPRALSRRYDAPAVMLAATFGFALGSSSAEGTKHLHRTDAGALVGLASFPELRTLRPRLAAIAEASDPLALQSAFAKAMLSADEHPPQLYFVDDHFVTYTGAQPVARGWNTRKRTAERGRDDTFVVDEAWRAICFSSSEPKGLVVNLPPVIDQLIEICGARPIMVGFDRGGAYPKVFSALGERNVDWVTYRRAPLVTPMAAPHISWVEVDSKRLSYRLADEMVELAGYGEARQLSCYEQGKVVFQILTSDTTTTAARLVRALRARWRIENTFKYAEEHHGIHWLCSYAMDEIPDDTQADNPARVKARGERKTAAAALAAARAALGAEAARPRRPIDDHLAEMRELRDTVVMAEDDLEEAAAALKGIPARLRRDEIHPGAIRAKSRIERRALQMVTRMLAYNAELDLARKLNTYLGDDDEYRGITRNLLHLGGTIGFRPHAITVKLDRPDPPRLARALWLLIEEINLRSPRLSGDGRTITFVLKG